MNFRYPFHRHFPISSSFEAHKKRTPPSRQAGTDFAAPSGEPVFAIAGGMVELAQGRGAGGLHVWVNHGRDEQNRRVKSYYAHLSSLEVTKLQIVKMGEKIGEVGSTGKSTGPHLHCSIELDREPVDPMDLLEPP